MTTELILSLIFIIAFGFAIPYFHFKAESKLGKSEPKSNINEFEFRDRYKKYQLFSVLLLLILLPILGVIGYFLYSLIIRIFLNNNCSETVIYPADYAPFYLSVISVMICADVIIFSLYRKLLKDKYVEFIRYYNTTYKMNMKTFFYKFRTRFVFPVLLILVIIASNWYIKIDDYKVTVNKPLSFNEITYPLNSLTKILDVAKVKVPAGNIKESQYYALKFDNNIVRFDMVGCFPNVRNDIKNAVLFLSEKTKIPITKIDYLN